MRLFKLKSSSLSNIFSWRTSGPPPVDAFPPEVAEISSLSCASSPSSRDQSDGWLESQRDSGSNPARAVKSENKLWKTWSRQRFCRLRHSVTASARRNDITDSHSDVINSHSDVTADSERSGSSLVGRSRSVRSLFYRRKSKRLKQGLESEECANVEAQKETQHCLDQQQTPSSTPPRKFPYAFIKSNCNRRRVLSQNTSVNSDSSMTPRSGIPADLLLPAPCGFQDDDLESRRESAMERGINRTISVIHESSPHFSDSGNDSIDSEPGYFSETTINSSWAREGAFPVRNEIKNSIDTDQSNKLIARKTHGDHVLDVTDSGCEVEAGMDVSRLMSTSSPILRPRRRHHGRRTNHAAALQDLPISPLDDNYLHPAHRKIQNMTEDPRRSIMLNQRKIMHDARRDSLHPNTTDSIPASRYNSTHQKKQPAIQYQSGSAPIQMVTVHGKETSTPLTSSNGHISGHCSRFGDTDRFLSASEMAAPANRTNTPSIIDTAVRQGNGREYMNIASLNAAGSGRC